MPSEPLVPVLPQQENRALQHNRGEIRQHSSSSEEDRSPEPRSRGVGSCTAPGNTQRAISDSSGEDFESPVMKKRADIGDSCNKSQPRASPADSFHGSVKLKNGIPIDVEDVIKILHREDESSF